MSALSWPSCVIFRNVHYYNPTYNCFLTKLSRKRCTARKGKSGSWGCTGLNQGEHQGVLFFPYFCLLSFGFWPCLAWTLSIQLFHNKVAKDASPLHPLWVLLSTDVIWKHTMHNMLIIATNHLSMLTVYIRHRDPNCPAPSPRLLCCHISRGGMATLPRNTFITFPQFASQSQGHRTYSAVTFNHRRFWFLHSLCRYALRANFGDMDFLYLIQGKKSFCIGSKF